MKVRGMTLGAIGFLLAAAIPADAGNQWIGGNDGTQHWSVPTNWHLNRVPLPTDEVNIGSSMNPTGDAWVLFDADDGIGYANACFLGRDYGARLDQSGGQIDVSLYIAISGISGRPLGRYNLSAGTLNVNLQPEDEYQRSQILIGSVHPYFGSPKGPGELNHTGGQVNADWMKVGMDALAKYAVGPAADLNVTVDFTMGGAGTLELLLDSQTDLDITVGGEAALDGYLWITGALTPEDLTTGVRIMTAGSYSGSFDAITPGFGVELRNSDTELWLVENHDPGPEPVELEWVTVADAGNAADTRYDPAGWGAVPAVYRISKYEVTNGQYLEFLNAVAAEDLHGLYNPSMSGTYGGIERSGAPGQYSYGLKNGDPNWLNRPVNLIGFCDACRFVNWLHNGKPTGPQTNSTTEDGAYFLNGVTIPPNESISRKPGARVFIPTESEWYKAAYYKGGGTDAGYWDYPTQSDTPPPGEEPPGTDLVNGSANYWDDGQVLGPPYYTTEVGAYTAKPSVGAYGTFDQGGNLWEWTEAIIDAQFRRTCGGCLYHSIAGLHASCVRPLGPDTEGSCTGIRVAAVLPQATDPNPDNGATGVRITADLSWAPPLGVISYDVYFGTQSPGAPQGNQTETTFDPGIMGTNTHYFWRIDSVTDAGTTTGEVWEFTTGPIPGDFDADDDVDQEDFGHLQECLTGSGAGPEPGCEDADLDLDQDVDQNDFGVYQACVSGANVPADPSCVED